MCFCEAYILSNIWMHLIKSNVLQMKDITANELYDENNKGYETDLLNALSLFGATPTVLMCNLSEEHPTNNICLVGVSFDNDVQKDCNSLHLCMSAAQMHCKVRHAANSSP